MVEILEHPIKCHLASDPNLPNVWSAAD
jgi:hypothetical protein